MAYVKYHYEGVLHQWGWTLYGANNAVIAWAYGYNTKAGARKAFRRVRQIMAPGEQIDEK